MTTKYLTGAYPGGYTLSATHAKLVIESSASVGGTGVTANFKATIDNFGSVSASNSGNGVSLNEGGTVINGSAAATAELIYGQDGVYVQNAPAKIRNFGVIKGYTDGVLLEAGGTVTNGSGKDTTALISGLHSLGVYARNTSATIANFGTIQGQQGGVGLIDGGSVTNGSAGDATALIVGVRGVIAGMASAVVTNFGTIQGLFGPGVILEFSGSVTNGSLTHTTALITGYFGISAAASATVVNYGAIRGASEDGVYLDHGGTVTNGSAGDVAALITGLIGVDAETASSTIDNFGTIAGSGSNIAGISLFAGGTVINGSAADHAALITNEGGSLGGIQAQSGLATIVNYGKITGPFGIDLRGGGTVINGAAGDTTAFISGSYGVFDYNASGVSAAVTNFGTIQGSGEGVALNGGGTVTNGSAADSTALIEGGLHGVVVGNATTVTNFGTIFGVSGQAVDFVDFGKADDVLVVEAGSAFLGTVLGGAGTLVLATGVGTIGDLTAGNVTVSASMPTTTFNNFGTLDIGTGAQFTLTGSGAIASGATALLTDDGAFTVTGALAVAGTIGGAGILTIAGGSQTIDAGASVTVAQWSLTGGTASVGEVLTYSGAFTESAGATLTVGAGDRLSLTKSATLGGAVNGAGTVAVASASLSGLTVGGTTILSVTGSATQTGNITIGDATPSAATFSIAKGATYTIGGAFNIGRGTAATSSLKVIGTLTSSAGTGMSVIGIKTADAGSVVASTGTLVFTAALTGAGTMTIDAGATLEADLTATSTLTATFTGAGATLALADPSKFAATIAGFAPGDTIELLGKNATSAVLNGSDQLVITNAGKAVATLQLTGAYTGDSFLATYDKASGNTAITLTATAQVTPPAAAAEPFIAPRPVLPFVAAMAGLDAGAGSAAVAPAHVEIWRPMILGPRSQMA